MNYKTIQALIMGFLISVCGVTAYAADDQTSNDENIVVGACMIQKFRESKPSLTDAKIEECSKVEANAAPQCLGFAEDEYAKMVTFCVSQLKNAKCVASKMNVPLMKYVGCGYEKDAAACFKGLGFTMDQIVQFSTNCQKEGAA